MEEKDEVPGFIILGDILRLSVATAPEGVRFRAWTLSTSPWGRVEAEGATAIGAVHALQTEVEKLLAAKVPARSYWEATLTP